jgi:serpin B
MARILLYLEATNAIFCVLKSRNIPDPKSYIMKAFSLFLALPIILLAASCEKNPQGPQQPKAITLTAKSAEVIASSNAFGIDLFRITAVEENANMMLSPLSASTALTMLLNGCGTQTYNQIRDMLGYEGLTLDEINAAYNSLTTQLLEVDPEVKLALANAVWYRKDFFVKESFLNTMDSSFDAEIATLDFSKPSALETINGWASDNTNGKIPKVLEEIEPDYVMFLMNALYFKGTWTYQFEESQTTDMPFHLAGGSSEAVKMMRSLIPVKMTNGNGAMAVELPYGRQNFAMVVILPDAPLNEFLSSFNPDSWAAITAGLDSAGDPVEMEVIVPKFKFEYEKFLNDQLKSLGMLYAFEPSMADLSGISDADIYVDFVKQNTFVDVNEEGTEAAAVTTIGIKEVSMPPSVMIDRPFIFAIRERMTNTLLFIGKVEKPEY